MLTRLVSDLFKQLGWTWTLSNGRVISPEDSDVERFFDEAAKHLYNEQDRARLTSGSLIIEKNKNEYDVYVYVGSYK